jgi:ion channel POLLUX/CASTOR
MKLNFSPDRLRYAFDNFMAKGTIALIGGLGAVSFVFISVMAFVVTVFGIHPKEGDRLDFVEALWANLMRTIDSGTVSGDTGWEFRLLMLLVTLGGIFVFSILIGLLSSGIESKLEELRKGRSRVIETDHIVILGWSAEIFVLISELAISNANRPQSCIVILSDMDKVDMEDALKERLGKLQKTRLVCRTGSPSNMADLGIVSIQTARSVVLLTPTQDHAESQVIKILLAITNIPRQVPTPYHIVVQVQDDKSSRVSKLIGHSQVEVVHSGDITPRMIVQTCRQSGLSVVYMDLLDFDGDEIYLKSEPKLVGETYGDALLAYEHSAVMGLLQNNGSVYLNPPSLTRIQQGDQIILIAEDDDKTQLDSAWLGAASASDRPIDQAAILSASVSQPRPESTLILGWNWQVPAMVTLLDQYVAPGSSVTIVSDNPEGEAILAAPSQPKGRSVRDQLVNQTLNYQLDTPSDRDLLERIAPETFDHIIVLCSDAMPPDQADAQTLLTLVQLRDIADQLNQDFAIVTEILDARNQALAQVMRPDDFVISEQIISRMLAQIAEQKMLNPIFQTLFSPEGSEIYLKPITEYVTTEYPINFYTVAESARRRGESAIGYRRQADSQNMAKAYGVVLNPHKLEQVQFSRQDWVIVLAEN